LASGGAIYVRDPKGLLSEDQLNGGEFAEFGDKDWQTVHPYLEENARLFNISVERLLTVNGERLDAEKVYRKIQPKTNHVLIAEEAWVSKQD
jgi:hypothetical protein